MAMNKVYNKKELISFKDLFLEVCTFCGRDWWNGSLNGVKEHIPWQFLVITFISKDRDNAVFSRTQDLQSDGDLGMFEVAAVSFPPLMLSIKIPGLYLGFITVSQSHRESIGYTDC